MYIKQVKTVQDKIHNIQSIINELNKSNFNLELINYNINTQKVLIVDKDTKEIIIDDYYNNLIFYSLNLDLLKYVINKYFYNEDVK